MKTTLRLFLGALFGVALVWGADIAVSLHDTKLPMPRVRNTSIPRVRPNNGVSVSFITTGTARPPGRRLRHGGGLGRYDVSFRAAIIQHPEGTLLFGTGVDPDGPEGLIYNPFGRVSESELPELPPVDAVILPTPRWYHMGGLDRWDSLAETPVRSGNGDLWQSRSGPWPRRYAMEPDRVRGLGRQIRAVTWARRNWFGFSRSVDWFHDRSVVLVRLRGSTIDEIGIVVTVDSGRRYLLVGDAVWTMDQVADLHPRTPWSTWLLDRNRMQLAGTIQQIHALRRDHEIGTVPLLDGELPTPEYPDTLP